MNPYNSRHSILDELKYTFKQGNMLTRLIYINLAVFLAVTLVRIVLFLFSIPAENFLVEYMAVPADVTQLIFKPWTVITYMFLHEQFLHILFNLLWFFWFGKIFLEYLTGRQLLSVYLLGGIAGAALYILAYNAFPAFAQSLPVSVALGASASVMAIVVATAVYVPNYTVHLMFIGPVKLKYIAIVSVFLDVVLLVDGNAGGHIAHIGGALFGYYFGSQIRKSKDVTKGFGKFMDSFLSWFKPRSKMKVTHKRKETDMQYNQRKAEEQHDIDSILEKISKSGYQSLSSKEKEMLFRQSRNN